jgi:hypothetical protein
VLTKTHSCQTITHNCSYPIGPGAGADLEVHILSPELEVLFLSCKVAGPQTYLPQSSCLLPAACYRFKTALHRAAVVPKLNL